MQATVDELAAQSYGRAKTLKFQQPHGLGRLRRLLGITPSDVLDLSGVRTLSSLQGGAFLLRDEEQVTLDVEFKLTHSEAECRVGFASGHGRGSHMPLTVCIRGAGVGTSSGTGFFISASGYTLAAHAFPGVHAGSWHALRAVLRNREVPCTSAHGGSTVASVLSMDVDLDGRALVRELALRPRTLPPAGHVVVVSRTPRRHTLYRGFRLTHGPSSIFAVGSAVHSRRTTGDGTTTGSGSHHGSDGQHNGSAAAPASHSGTECPPPARPDLQQVPETSAAGCSSGSGSGSGSAGGACSACEHHSSEADSGAAPGKGRGAASCSAACGGCRGADDSAAEPGLLFLELYENVMGGRNDSDGGEQGAGRGNGPDDDWEHVGTEDFNGPDEDRGLGDGCVDFSNGDGNVSEDGSRRSLDVSQLCAICLSARKQAGFLHGASMHIAACRRCALCFTEGMPCPVCRVKVDRVVTDLYYT